MPRTPKLLARRRSGSSWATSVDSAVSADPILVPASRKPGSSAARPSLSGCRRPVQSCRKVHMFDEPGVGPTDAGWEPDEDDQCYRRCGDNVATLSTDYLCNACVAEDEAGDEPADSCEGQDAAEDEGGIYQVVRGEWQGPYLEWEPDCPAGAGHG